MVTKRPLPFDPIAEAGRQWARRWEGREAMAAATGIMRAQQIVLGTVDRALAGLELTFARYEALVLLHFSRRGSLPLGKMGDRLQVHPTSVTNIVDRLEAQGFVHRTRHPTDRRTTLAEITREGRAVVEKATRAVVSTRFGLDVLSDDDLAALAGIITKLRLRAGDFREAPGGPPDSREAPGGPPDSREAPGGPPDSREAPSSGEDLPSGLR